MSGKTYELRFDGTCWPNPGGIAGYGWVLLMHRDGADPLPVAEGCGPVPAPPGSNTTNNVAEWHGLRCGLEWFQCLRTGVTRLLIRGDSQLVVKQLTGEWGCNSGPLRAYLESCKTLLGQIGVAWEAAWMPREENARTDELAGVHGAHMPEHFRRQKAAK